jgi:hypothetical protein
MNGFMAKVGFILSQKKFVIYIMLTIKELKKLKIMLKIIKGVKSHFFLLTLMKKILIILLKYQLSI